jgi:hypothetical protein
MEMRIWKRIYLTPMDSPESLQATVQHQPVPNSTSYHNIPCQAIFWGKRPRSQSK